MRLQILATAVLVASSLFFLSYIIPGATAANWEPDPFEFMIFEEFEAEDEKAINVPFSTYNSRDAVINRVKFYFPNEYKKLGMEVPEAGTEMELLIDLRSKLNGTWDPVNWSVKASILEVAFGSWEPSTEEFVNSDGTHLTWDITLNETGVGSASIVIPDVHGIFTIGLHIDNGTESIDLNLTQSMGPIWIHYPEADFYYSIFRTSEDDGTKNLWLYNSSIESYSLGLDFLYIYVIDFDRGRYIYTVERNTTLTLWMRTKIPSTNPFLGDVGHPDTVYNVSVRYGHNYENVAPDENGGYLTWRFKANETGEAMFNVTIPDRLGRFQLRMETYYNEEASHYRPLNLAQWNFTVHPLQTLEITNVTIVPEAPEPGDLITITGRVEYVHFDDVLERAEITITGNGLRPSAGLTNDEGMFSIQTSVAFIVSNTNNITITAVDPRTEESATHSLNFTIEPESTGSSEKPFIDETTATIILMMCILAVPFIFIALWKKVKRLPGQ